MISRKAFKNRWFAAGITEVALLAIYHSGNSLHHQQVEFVWDSGILKSFSIGESVTDNYSTAFLWNTAARQEGT